MQLCAKGCGRWAQWVILFPEVVGNPEVDKKLHLVPAGRKFRIGPYLCAEHKEAQEKVPSDVERIFKFTGATVGTANP